MLALGAVPSTRTGWPAGVRSGQH